VEHLAPDTPSAVPELVPARMLNEFTYCPRLGYLMWVDGEWADSHDTEDGRRAHRRVDREGGPGLPDAGADARDDEAAGQAPLPTIHARSVWVSGERVGITARCDLVEAEGLQVTPVDYKRGEKPELGPWEPERVQLCAQGLVLEEAGYQCDHGVLYYVASKTRVDVRFDAALRERTLALLAEFRRVAAQPAPPPPLADSPKCPRCSLVGICLPDELGWLSHQAADEGPGIGLPGVADPGAGDPGAAGPESVGREGSPGADPTPADIRDDELQEVAAVAGDGAGEGSWASFAAELAPPERAQPDRVRRLLPARDDALPLYVQDQGARVGKTGECLKVELKGAPLREVRLLETSQVSLFGGVQITTQAVHELLGRGIPLCFFSQGGWFHGWARSATQKNIELRRRQFAVADDPDRCLSLARGFVAAKIRNCRTLLRRNAEDLDDGVLGGLRRAAEEAESAPSLASLLGIEGNAARVYFGSFARMLRLPDEDSRGAFSPEGRNRRPPRDPVNALLSFGYALLTKDWTVTLQTVGFDPLLGFYHQPRYGKPALALDCMEEFRPLVVDSVVITLINTREIRPGDFVRSAGAVALKPNGRKTFLQAYERRMDQLVTHPVFGYRISYRRTLEVQARLLARTLSGEIPELPSFCTR